MASARSPAAAAAPRRDAPAWRIATVPAGADLAAAEAFCRDVARRHYENFTVATRLVPSRLRQHLATVYAFARWSDDLADEAGSPEEAVRALAAWRHDLEECFAGRAAHPVFIALAATARQADLGIGPFADLIDAFAEDARFDAAGTHVRYATRADLLGYCHRSADPVGRIVLALEGCRDAAVVALSDSICTGLQLVNFWQDLARDAAAGRVYLPGADLERHGVSAAMLHEPRAPRPLVELVREEVAWARECFDAGAALVRRAPPALRPAVELFLAGGRAVADAIERAGHDTLARRPTVSRWRKAALACRAWWRLRGPAGVEPS